MFLSATQSQKVAFAIIILYPSFDNFNIHIGDIKVQAFQQC